jgi:dihydrofolate reductase
VLQALVPGVAKVTLESARHNDSKGVMSHRPRQTSLTSIVAIDKNGAIGCQNALPWRLKSDLAFFRRTTTDNTVIMGRKTYESIGCCLPNRKNVVLSHGEGLFTPTPNCSLVHSIDEALIRAHEYRSSKTFVIGGAATYAQFSHLIDKYLVTIVDHEAQDADAFLAPEILEDLSNWKGKEIASFPATPDRDDFGFRVLELIAPDIEARQAERSAIVTRYSARNNKQASTQSKCDGYLGTQVAFGA